MFHAMIVSSALALTHLALVAPAQADTFDSIDYFTQYKTQDRYQTAEVIAEQNTKTLADLRVGYVNATPRRAEALARFEMEALLTAVIEHPVAKLGALPNYDPQGGIGFCFGRAMTAHLEALLAGLSKSSIKKLWALGDLSTGEMRWRYHVTTLVRGQDGTWYAIDPIWYGVLTAEEWYESMKAFDPTGTMKLYVTDAAKFGPSSGKYNNGHLMDKFYNKYFDDLLDHTAKKSKRIQECARDANTHPEFGSVYGTFEACLLDASSEISPERSDEDFN